MQNIDGCDHVEYAGRVRDAISCHDAVSPSVLAATQQTIRQSVTCPREEATAERIPHLFRPLGGKAAHIPAPAASLSSGASQEWPCCEQCVEQQIARAIEEEGPS